MIIKHVSTRSTDPILQVRM